MKVMTVSLSPDPSPARGEGRFVSRIRDFHIKHPRSGCAPAPPPGLPRHGQCRNDARWWSHHAPGSPFASHRCTSGDAPAPTRRLPGLLPKVLARGQHFSAQLVHLAAQLINFALQGIDPRLPGNLRWWLVPGEFRRLRIGMCRRARGDGRSGGRGSFDRSGWIDYCRGWPPTPVPGPRCRRPPPLAPPAAVAQRRRAAGAACADRGR
jgi:hypothetical protein